MGDCPTTGCVPVPSGCGGDDVCATATTTDRGIAAVSESAGVGTILYRFSATDADLGPNGAVRFSTSQKDFGRFEGCDRSVVP